MKRYIAVWVVSMFVLSIHSIGHAAFLRQQQLIFPGMNPVTGLHGITQFNPSWINKIQSPVLSGHYTKLFSMSELPENHLFAGMPFPWGRLGVSALVFGNEWYTEETISVVFGRRLSEQGALGLNVNYHQLTLQNYGSAQAVSADIGGYWLVTEHLTWELSYSNLNQATIGESLEPLPQHFFTGFAYSGAEKLLTRLFIIHDLEMTPRFGLQASYEALPWLQADLVAVTNPVRLMPRLHLEWKLIGIAYGLATHPDLPFTHSFGLSLRF